MAENELNPASEAAVRGDPRPDRDVPPAAQRALAEAEARRKAFLEREAALPREVGGRGGHDPVRYGDWEIKGIAADF
jgi:hypothetical protein